MAVVMHEEDVRVVTGLVMVQGQSVMVRVVAWDTMSAHLVHIFEVDVVPAGCRPRPALMAHIYLFQDLGAMLLAAWSSPFGSSQEVVLILDIPPRQYMWYQRARR